jgi:hypothetical protein
MRYVVERSLVLKKRTIVEVDIQGTVVGVGDFSELRQPSFLKVQS